FAQLVGFTLSQRVSVPDLRRQWRRRSGRNQAGNTEWEIAKRSTRGTAAAPAWNSNCQGEQQQSRDFTELSRLMHGHLFRNMAWSRSERAVSSLFTASVIGC